GRDGDRINAVLAAAGYNYSLLLRWFEELLRALSLILWHALLAAPPHLTRCRKTFFTADSMTCDATNSGSFHPSCYTSCRESRSTRSVSSRCSMSSSLTMTVSLSTPRRRTICAIFFENPMYSYSDAIFLHCMIRYASSRLARATRRVLRLIPTNSF